MRTDIQDTTKAGKENPTPSPVTPAKASSFHLEYAPAPESRDLVRIREQNDLFIGGKFVAPQSGEYFPTLNPATGEILSRLALANDADVDLAVKTARKAYEQVWSKTSGRDRARYLFRIARLIQERARELAVLETLDNGKPIKETRDV
ncbi:MAG: aldehyde dehydrogenase family protein, partial [Bdellovibrionales bacterium]|nr:aldehyde dehydrogenase family protein [Bdellovibrionales bacterium]